ncbi:ATP-dependent RNA helicase MAK5, putative, partial [Hepatocystis sp. ex Piliocolobus tephrosceles]
MDFKKIKIKPSILKELKQEGLISIEAVDGSEVKVLDTNNLQEGELKNVKKSKIDKNDKAIALNKKKKKKLNKAKQTELNKNESHIVVKKKINKKEKSNGKISRRNINDELSGTTGGLNGTVSGLSDTTSSLSHTTDSLSHTTDSYKINNKKKVEHGKTKNKAISKSIKKKQKKIMGDAKKKLKRLNDNNISINSDLEKSITEEPKKGKMKKNKMEKRKNKMEKRKSKMEKRKSKMEKRKSKMEKHKSKMKKGKENQIAVPSKKRFDINEVIKNEKNFPKSDDIKYLIHCKEWSINKSVDILHNILKSLYDNNFLSPKEIQKQTLTDSIKLKKDIVVISKTGTGKTLTFCIPILNNIVQKKIKMFKKKNKINKPKLQCIVLVPTRELAIQINKHFTFVNKYVNIYIATIIGGLSVIKQNKILAKKPEIVICTPGRLRYFLQPKQEKKQMTNLYDLKHIRYFVCDEVDKLIETSFLGDIKFIAKHMYKCVGEKKKFIQTFLLSATLNLTVQMKNENLINLLNCVAIRTDKHSIFNLNGACTVAHENSGNNSNHTTYNINTNTRHTISNNVSTCTNKNYMDTILPDTLSLKFVKCKKNKILHKLFYLLKNFFFNEEEEGEEEGQEGERQKEGEQQPGSFKKVIIFLNTIKDTKNAATMFQFLFFDKVLESSIPNKYRINKSLKKNINIYCLHSKLLLKERIKKINIFSQKNQNSILFCTDVLSRGIDLHKCDLIVQLNCPVTDITFVHRSGRTARNLQK